MGLGLIKGKINTTFFMSNCDILINENYVDIYRYHIKNKNVLTMVCSFKTGSYSIWSSYNESRWNGSKIGRKTANGISYEYGIICY